MLLGTVLSSFSLISVPLLGTRMADGPVLAFHALVGSVRRPAEATRFLFGWETGSKLAVWDS